jgi:AraC family transcriptional regulator, transcriptional activator of pobA
MSKAENTPAAYPYSFRELPASSQPKLGQVNAFRLEESVASGIQPKQYSRRDYYKIALIRGHYAYHYADKSLEIAGPALMFFNPQVPYTWQPLADDTTGYFCIFREEFLHAPGGLSLLELPLFRPGGDPAYLLTASQDQEVSALFEKMLAELASDYVLKYDLLRNYAAELVHYALKLRPATTHYQHPDAKSRLAAVFSELLERQFPVESPARRLGLRSASDFARQLAVHVNHLNRCVRYTTGKTTTAHIAERLAAEARALLRHTDWNIAEVGYSLGFDEPAHFNYFFKKQTGQTPSAFRLV